MNRGASAPLAISITILVSSGLESPRSTVAALLDHFIRSFQPVVRNPPAMALVTRRSCESTFSLLRSPLH